MKADPMTLKSTLKVGPDSLDVGGVTVIRFKHKGKTPGLPTSAVIQVFLLPSDGQRFLYDSLGETVRFAVVLSDGETNFQFEASVKAFDMSLRKRRMIGTIRLGPCSRSVFRTSLSS